MPAMPQSAAPALAATDGADTALEIARLQARLSELLAGRASTSAQPVTFRCLGAGAHRAVGDEGVILFCFPVHHDKVVRIAAEYATACGFADSLVKTLGGWDAVCARGLKRGNRQ